jgi:hypothetical protein
LESKRRAEQIDFQNQIGELQKRNAMLEKKKKKQKPASKKGDGQKLAKVSNILNVSNVSNVFKPKTLQDLPPEILLKILGFCPQPDLHRHVALVSVTQFSQS